MNFCCNIPDCQFFGGSHITTLYMMTFHTVTFHSTPVRDVTFVPITTPNNILYLNFTKRHHKRRTIWSKYLFKRNTCQKSTLKTRPRESCLEMVNNYFLHPIDILNPLPFNLKANQLILLTLLLQGGMKKIEFSSPSLPHRALDFWANILSFNLILFHRSFKSILLWLHLI